MIKGMQKIVKIGLLLIVCIGLIGCTNETEKKTSNTPTKENIDEKQTDTSSINLATIPEYTGNPYVIIEDNVPDFETYEVEEALTSYEYYSPLDDLGRCQEVQASIGQDLMPTGERESISDVKPSGWNNEDYPCVDGSWIWNRSHLIGFQLSGENANEKNLITGTRYMNVEGMLPFENQVANYVKSTGNHVLYEVTPIYEGDNLVASGVQMEAYSVEDQGQGVQFNVYCYNVQPDIIIDYSNGETQATKACTIDAVSDKKENNTGDKNDSSEYKYILNKNSKKIHLPDCSNASSMNKKNKEFSSSSIEELESQGYVKAKCCF